MRLADAAKHFHTYQALDYYNQTVGFTCQFDLFDDARRDGLTVERRIMEVAPDVVIPARRTILTADGKVWLVGDDQPDYFGTEVLRNKFVVHLTGTVATVRTFAQALAGSGGFTAMASRSWIKAVKEAELSSDVANEYNIYFARGEPIVEATLVLLESRWHIIRSVFPSLAGYAVTLADELMEPVVTTCAYSSRVYAPKTDTRTTTTTTVAALRLRWQDYFKYATKDADKYLAGDIVVLVLKTIATVAIIADPDATPPVVGVASATIVPVASDLITLSGENYRVDEVMDEGSCWGLHLRHV